VRYRDLRDLLGHILNLLFFASPIIYSLEGLDVPSWLRSLLVLNPFSVLVRVYRDAAFSGTISAPSVWLMALGISVAMWLVGVWIFSRHRDTIVESV
jgi:ABC-type polysaccharide/polyol phosphate export permease